MEQIFGGSTCTCRSSIQPLSTHVCVCMLYVHRSTDPQFTTYAGAPLRGMIPPFFDPCCCQFPAPFSSSCGDAANFMANTHCCGKRGAKHTRHTPSVISLDEDASCNNTSQRFSMASSHAVRGERERGPRLLLLLCMQIRA